MFSGHKTVIWAMSPNLLNPVFPLALVGPKYGLVTVVWYFNDKAPTNVCYECTAV